MYSSRTLLSGLLIGLTLTVLAITHLPDSSPQQAHPMHGLKVFVDPATGKLVRDPGALIKQLDTTAHEQNPATKISSTTSSTLRETPPVQAGMGYRVRLEDRFRLSLQTPASSPAQ